MNKQYIYRERIQLSTCQHPSTHRMGMVAGEISCTSQVLSTSPAISCYTNYLQRSQWAAQETTVSHSVEVSSKRAFLVMGVKEMLTMCTQIG